MFGFILMFACFAIGAMFQIPLAFGAGVILMFIILILATLGTPRGITIDGDKM